MIEPDDQVAAIGSGSAYAQAAALALLHHSDLTARQIAQTPLEIAADLCIYTNRSIVVLTLGEASDALSTNIVPPESLSPAD